MFELDGKITEWRDHLISKGNFSTSDIEELEGHLRDEIGTLRDKGLDDEEAFFIGVKRLGNADAISREFSKVNIDSLWKFLMRDAESPEEMKKNRRELVLIGLLTALSAAVALIPTLFGYTLTGGRAVAYALNFGFFFVPMITAYFIWKRRTRPVAAAAAALPFAVSVVLINVYPFQAGGQTAMLAAFHLPIMLWFVMGYVYKPPEALYVQGKMNFIRYTGETFIYTVLIYCGGIVFAGIGIVIFMSLGISIDRLVWDHLAVLGIFGAPVLATYLVEAKKSVVENLAPILARIFSPLFTVLMVIFLIVMAVLGTGPFMNRNILIGFDVLLVVVLAMVLYVISARTFTDEPGLFDYLNLALILAALVVDIVALSAVVFRLSSFGISANKMAALGENVLLLANLAGLAVLYVLFFLRKIPFKSLEVWQTRYLPVYMVWMTVVVFVFPPIFGFG